MEKRCPAARHRQHPTQQPIHEPTPVEPYAHVEGFSYSESYGTVAPMKWALMIILGCETGGLGQKTDVSMRTSGSSETIRSCLDVAAGMQKKALKEDASKQVMVCYEQHFSPLKPTLRKHNPKATLSLEYGFGLLARQMTMRHDGGVAMAGQLADRVESVIESTQAAPNPPSDDSG